MTLKSTYPGIVITSLLFCVVCPIMSWAQESVEVGASIITNMSSGEFAPYFIGSLNHGKTTQKSSGLVDFSISKYIDPESTIGFGFGAEVLGGATSRNDYDRWNAANSEWALNPQGPAPVWLQQLYAEVKFHSIYLLAGMKEHSPALLSPTLSSGDFVESGNSRPIPELRCGFYDFVDVPFTNGWVQINGEVGYGLMPDGKFMDNHYNYYNYHIAKNSIYNYKFCYFRSNPDQPFMVTAGMQSGAFFGGSSEYYHKGVLEKTNTYDLTLKSFFDMLMPVFNNAETFAAGSTLGSWDFYAQYMFNSGDEICAYFEWPFEDGSGIGRRNKIDGIWGLEYRSAVDGPVTGLVLEYIDFRDQSGPIHFAPADFETPTITTEATGRDNYYNNGFYNSYANYGMSIGTPFLLSPLYNLNGYPAFTCTRANGVHVGIEGFLSERMGYRALFSYQRGFGTYDIPYSEKRTDTSFMLEGTYDITDNLALKGMVAVDRGDLRGDNFGALLSLTYRGAVENLFSR